MFKDGTTRDPSAVAALHGVFLNRGDNVPTAVARPDVEGATSGRVARFTAARGDASRIRLSRKGRFDVQRERLEPGRRRSNNNDGAEAASRM